MLIQFPKFNRVGTKDVSGTSRLFEVSDDSSATYTSLYLPDANIEFGPRAGIVYAYGTAQLQQISTSGQTGVDRPFGYGIFCVDGSEWRDRIQEDLLNTMPQKLTRLQLYQIVGSYTDKYYRTPSGNVARSSELIYAIRIRHNNAYTTKRLTVESGDTVPVGSSLIAELTKQSVISTTVNTNGENDDIGNGIPMIIYDGRGDTWYVPQWNVTNDRYELIETPYTGIIGSLIAVVQLGHSAKHLAEACYNSVVEDVIPTYMQRFSSDYVKL